MELNSIISDVDSVEYGICFDYFLKHLISFFIDFALGLIISISNAVIEFIFFRIVMSLKYFSNTLIIINMIYFSLLAEYFNTGFIVYLIYSDIFGFSIVEIINTIFAGNFLKIQNLVLDVDREWYLKIGSKLIIPLMISIFDPLYSFFTTLFLNHLKKRKEQKKKKKNQNHIIKIELPEFDLAGNFKDLLKSILLSLTFATGLPILYSFVFVGFLLTFWLHKYLLIKHSERPLPYSTNLIKSLYKILKISLIIHILFSIYFLSNGSIFASEINFDIDGGKNNHKRVSKRGQAFDHSRIFKVYSLVILLCVILVVYFFEYFFVRKIKKIFWFFRNRKIGSLFAKNDSTKLEENWDILEKNLHKKIKLENNFEEVTKRNDKNILEINSEDDDTKRNDKNSEDNTKDKNLLEKKSENKEKRDINVYIKQNSIKNSKKKNKKNLEKQDNSKKKKTYEETKTKLEKYS